MHLLVEISLYSLHLTLCYLAGDLGGLIISLRNCCANTIKKSLKLGL